MALLEKIFYRVAINENFLAQLPSPHNIYSSKDAIRQYYSPIA